MRVTTKSREDTVVAVRYETALTKAGIYTDRDGWFLIVDDEGTGRSWSESVREWRSDEPEANNTVEWYPCEPGFSLTFIQE